MNRPLTFGKISPDRKFERVVLGCLEIEQKRQSAQKYPVWRCRGCGSSSHNRCWVGVSSRCDVVASLTNNRVCIHGNRSWVEFDGVKDGRGGWNSLIAFKNVTLEDDEAGVMKSSRNQFNIAYFYQPQAVSNFAVGSSSSFFFFLQETFAF